MALSLCITREKQIHFLMNIKLKDLILEAYIDNFTMFQREVFKELMSAGVDLTSIFMDKNKMNLFGGAIRQFMNSNYSPAGYDTGDETEDEVKEKLKDYALKTIDLINKNDTSAIPTDKAMSL